MMSLSYPGNVGLVVRKDLVDLKATTMEEFRRFCGQYHQGLPIKWNMSSPIRCDLFTGRHDHRGDPIYSRIWWSDTKDPESWRSGNLGWCMIDEATEVSHDFVQMIRAALGRHTLPDGTRPPKRLVWASNPGPGWCKREYPVGTKSLRRMVDLELDDGSRGQIERVFIPAAPKDNPHLPTDFEAQLRANYSEIWVKRWVEGDWSAFEGMVFPDFTVDRHVLPKKVDLSGYGHRHFLTMDWGYRNPAACMVVSKDGDDHWWVWKEYYAKERTPDQHSTFVRKLMRGLGPHTQLMDPAAVDQSDGVPIWQQFNRMSYSDPGERFRFSGWPKAKHGPEGTIVFMQYLLRNDMLHVSPDCHHFIEELGEAEWEPLSSAMEDRSNPKEKMKDRNDHCIDAVFGAMQYWRLSVRQAPMEEEMTGMEKTFADAMRTPKIERMDMVDTVTPVGTRSSNERADSRKRKRRSDPYEGL